MLPPFIDIYFNLFCNKAPGVILLCASVSIKEMMYNGENTHCRR